MQILWEEGVAKEANDAAGCCLRRAQKIREPPPERDGRRRSRAVVILPETPHWMLPPHTLASAPRHYQATFPLLVLGCSSATSGSGSAGARHCLVSGDGAAEKEKPWFVRHSRSLLLGRPRHCASCRRPWSAGLGLIHHEEARVAAAIPPSPGIVRSARGVVLAASSISLFLACSCCPCHSRILFLSCN